MLILNILLEISDLLHKRLQEKDQPNIPSRIVAPQRLLRRAQGDVVALLRRFDDALERTVRRIDVAGAKQQERRQRTRLATVPILERMDGEKSGNEHPDDDERRHLLVLKPQIEPFDEFLH